MLHKRLTLFIQQSIARMIVLLFIYKEINYSSISNLPYSNSMYHVSTGYSAFNDNLVNYHNIYNTFCSIEHLWFNNLLFPYIPYSCWTWRVNECLIIQVLHFISRKMKNLSSKQQLLPQQRSKKGQTKRYKDHLKERRKWKKKWQVWRK